MNGWHTTNTVRPVTVNEEAHVHGAGNITVLDTISNPRFVLCSLLLSGTLHTSSHQSHSGSAYESDAMGMSEAVLNVLKLSWSKTL